MLAQAAISRFLRPTAMIKTGALTTESSLPHLEAFISSTPELMLRPSLRPPYLFRVHSSSSEEPNSGSSIRSHDPSLLTRAVFGGDTAIRAKNQLFGSAKDVPFLSTTSSLLWAMVHARHMTMLGEKGVKITLTAPMLLAKASRVNIRHAEAAFKGSFATDGPLQDGSFFAATDLAAAPTLKSGDHYRRDGLAREYLVSGGILDEAILGSTTYEATATDIETLLVALAGQPFPLVHESSKPCQDTWFTLIQAMENPPATPLRNAEYEAARGIAKSFNSDRDSFPLTLMCLAFQRRDEHCLDWSQVIGRDQKDIKRVVSGSRWISRLGTLAATDNFGYLHEEPVFHGKPELEEWKALMRAAKIKSTRE